MLTLITPSCKQLRGQRTLLTRKTQEEFSNVQQQKDNEVATLNHNHTELYFLKNLKLIETGKAGITALSVLFPDYATAILSALLNVSSDTATHTKQL
jgi:hypothetical protein